MHYLQFILHLKNNEKKAVFNSILFIVPIVLFVGSGLLDIIFIHSLETFDLVNKGLVMKFSTILYTIAAIIGLPVLEHLSKIKFSILLVTKLR